MTQHRFCMLHASVRFASRTRQLGLSLQNRMIGKAGVVAKERHNRLKDDSLADVLSGGDGIQWLTQIRASRNEISQRLRVFSES